MMRNVTKHLHGALLASAAAAAGLAGCNTSSVPQLDWQAAPSDVDAGATGAEGGEPGDGLPCAIADLLATRCQGCHSAHPSAPMSLVTYADLDAPSRSNPARKVRDLALERMGSTSAPMPPSAPLGADDIAVFAAWLKEGAVRATCGTGKGDGGTRDATGPECALASDCPGALICRAGVCDVECVTDKDCPTTTTCEETRCRPAVAAPDAGSIARYGDLTSTAAWSTTTLGDGALGTYSGTVFDGRFVYFAPDSAGSVLRYDTTMSFASARAWSTFDVTGLNARANTYRGAIFDGRYVYLVPFGAGATLARYDTTAPYLDASSWTLFDLRSVTGSLGFAGGTFDGRYVYLTPAGSAGVALRHDTSGSVTNTATWSTFAIPTVNPAAKSFVGSVSDGRYVYFIPNGGAAGPRGVLARYDADAPFAQASSWSTLDLATLDAKAVGFRTAAFDGRFLYLVPGWTAPTPTWATSTVARFDTQQPLGVADSWRFFDTSTVDPDAVGFNAAVFDGRHLILAPGYNGGAYHGNVLSYDTATDLTAKTSWSRFDTTSVAASARNMRGTSFDGRFVYFAPASGLATRFDARPSGRTSSATSILGGSFY